MATASTSTLQSKSVDASLWWDPFAPLLTDLENSSLSSDIPPSLVKRLEANHAWFLDTLSLFKPPNQKSREALNSSQVNIGSHQLTVQPELKAAALEISSSLCLDEVQSYIIVKRSNEVKTLASDHIVHIPLHLAMLQYYTERQCLLKCTRQILTYSLYIGNGEKEVGVMGEKARKLITDGLENKLVSVLQGLLSSTYPENLDVDLFTLWAEETLIEDNLVLDILFLAYYESFCTCNGKQWKKLCLLYEAMISGACNFGKLAMSTEIIQSIYQAKVQLLLILIETLDLEYLLQMIYDEMTFRQGITAFSLTDIQEIDAIISGYSIFENKEAGPLILTWAVFLCLISSLPQKEEYNEIMEIDHVGYVRQAFEAASLNYFVEILQSNLLKDSDDPRAGYQSVLRTFMSSFIASYEISLQLEDNNFKLILDILGKIYRGEESLCSQFWDKGSFIDGPVRCLLCNLEGDFPFRTVELVRLLSALCEGTWPAECVYNFLDKSVGLSSLFEITRGSVVDNTSQMVETQQPLCIPGIEGIVIPHKTRGHVLKLIDENTALVRWEYKQSGFLVLLLRLAQKIHLDATEEVLVILDLLSRLVTFNPAVCYALMDTRKFSYGGATRANGSLEKVDVVELICTIVKNSSPNCDGAVMMSMGVNILTKMLKCSPSCVSVMALNANIFDVALNTNPLGVASDGFSSGAWLLSGRLAKLILMDCEHNESFHPLTISVLDFTMKLVEMGVENDVVLALVVFSVQYVLVNHESWKYKVKHVRWQVRLKVLEVIKKCILSISYSRKLGKVVQDILLFDSSVHNALFRITCTTTEALEKHYVSRLYEVVEIEGFELAVCSVLDILFIMLSDLSKDMLPGFPVFYQAVVSSATKPIPVSTAMTSLISYFRNPAVQLGAARVLSMLFIIADYSQSYMPGEACFGLGDKQISNFRNGVNSILCEESPYNEDLVVTTFKLLTCAANYQPAFIVVVISVKENTMAQPSEPNGAERPKEANLVDAILEYVGKSNDLINSNPKILLNVLNFLKSLWQGASQFIDILEQLKSSGNFWKQVSTCISLVGRMQEDTISKNLTEGEILSTTYRCHCQSNVLEIMAYELFLQKKLLQQSGQTSELLNNGINNGDGTRKTKDEGLCGLQDILSTWCGSSVMGTLVNSYTSSEFDHDIYLRSKIAAGLFFVHVMGRLRSGDTGSLCLSLIEKLNKLFKKLSDLPAYSELSSQYTHCGYSEGKELNSLILSDLYYHMQGELEGRRIEHRPFRDLSHFLLESKFLQTYMKYDKDLLAHANNDVYLFDTNCLEADLGLDMWEYSEWKASKGVAETMLLHLRDLNSMTLLANSKQSALEALTSILSMYDEDPTENKKTTIRGKIPEKVILPSVDHICGSLNATIESLSPVPDNSEVILAFLAAQAELLLHLIRSSNKRLPLPVCVLILKSSSSGLKMLTDFRPSGPGVRAATKVLLMLLLLSVEVSCVNSQPVGLTDMESIEANADASNASLGLLPILCYCMEPADHCTLSLTTIDLILKRFLMPTTWFPIIQKHLQLQCVINYLQDKNSVSSIPVILKFLLTLARVRDGAEMLLNVSFFASIRVLLADLSDGNDKIEKPHQIWGLGLAVVTAIIQSLGDSSSCRNLVDHVMDYFFFEKSYMISHYLNAPDLPSDFHDRKRPRAQKTHTTLTALKEMEHTLVLICVLSKHQNSWIKAAKEIDSPLREKCIHLLSFISRGNRRIGESPSRVPPLFCHPVLKEEFEWHKKPSFVNSKSGWFALSPLGCGLDPQFSNVSLARSGVVIRDRVTENAGLAQTFFSDTAAVQIYRIAFLILKFLCLQADSATKRAGEIGFIDVARFPELPVPEILHGLQDQGITIVNELCEANKLRQVSSEIQGICVLLLQITEMALYLEFCVSQTCGLKPVLGRVEDFTKELISLIRATEGQVFLKESMKSVKQIISFLYPGLLQTEGFM